MQHSQTVWLSASVMPDCIYLFTYLFPPVDRMVLKDKSYVLFFGLKHLALAQCLMHNRYSIFCQTVNQSYLTEILTSFIGTVLGLLEWGTVLPHDLPMFFILQLTKHSKGHWATQIPMLSTCHPNTQRWINMAPALNLKKFIIEWSRQGRFKNNKSKTTCNK